MAPSNTIRRLAGALPLLAVSGAIVSGWGMASAFTVSGWTHVASAFSISTTTDRVGVWAASPTCSPSNCEQLATPGASELAGPAALPDARAVVWEAGRGLGAARVSFVTC